MTYFKSKIEISCKIEPKQIVMHSNMIPKFAKNIKVGSPMVFNIHLLQSFPFTNFFFCCILFVFLFYFVFLLFFLVFLHGFSFPFVSKFQKYFSAVFMSKFQWKTPPYTTHKDGKKNWYNFTQISRAKDEIGLKI